MCIRGPDVKYILACQLINRKSRFCAESGASGTFPNMFVQSEIQFGHYVRKSGGNCGNRRFLTDSLSHIFFIPSYI